MSVNTEFSQILTAIGKLSDEVHQLSAYLGRLDERIVSLDSKVDNRVSGVEVQVKSLESRVQGIVDKCQDIEIRLNRIKDSHAGLQKEYEQEQARKESWMNRYVIPLLLAGTIATLSSMLTITFKG